MVQKHSIATITHLRSSDLLTAKTPLLHMLYYMNWLTHDFWTRTGGWEFDRSHGAGTSSPSHWQQVDEQAPKPVGWMMCFKIQDFSRFKIVYCYTSVSRHIHTKHIVTSWKLFRSCNHSKKKHIMTSWHRNQCCKTHWANNTRQDRGQLIEFGHCPGQHCRPIRKTLILNTRKVSLDIVSVSQRER